MSQILNQPWEDVADDVTSAIEKAVQPLLKKAVDDIYGGLLDATQDYLKGNLAFNIASRIGTAEREASDARQENVRLREALADLVSWFPKSAPEPEWRIKAGQWGADDAVKAARAALAGPSIVGDEA